MISQKQITDLRLNTILELEASVVSGGVEDTICICNETKTVYLFYKSAPLLVVDGQKVVSSVVGVDARWVGIAGQYNYFGGSGGGAGLRWDISDPLFSNFYVDNDIASLNGPVDVFLDGDTDFGTSTFFILDAGSYTNCHLLNFIGNKNHSDPIGFEGTAVVGMGADFGHQLPHLKEGVALLTFAEIGNSNTNAINWHIGNDCLLLNAGSGMGGSGPAILIGTENVEIHFSGDLMNPSGFGQPIFHANDPGAGLTSGELRIYTKEGAYIGSDIASSAAPIQGDIGDLTYIVSSSGVNVALDGSGIPDNSTYAGNQFLNRSNDSYLSNYDNTVSGLVSDNVKSAIDELVTMFGNISAEKLYLKNQTIDGAVSSGTGVTFNIDLEQWEVPSNESQTIGIYLSAIGTDTQCILLRGALFNSSFNALSAGRHWFSSSGVLTTTESRTFAGYKLPNGLFIFKPEVEYGRQGPFNVDTTPPVSMGWLSLLGDLNNGYARFEKMALTATLSGFMPVGIGHSTNLGQGFNSIIGAFDSGELDSMGGHNIIDNGFLTWPEGFTSFGYLNCALDFGTFENALLFGARFNLGLVNLVSIIRNFGTATPTMVGLKTALNSGMSYPKDIFNPKSVTFRNSVGHAGWFYVSGDYTQNSKQSLINWDTDVTGISWTLGISYEDHAGSGTIPTVGPFTDATTANDIETAINAQLSIAGKAGRVTVAGDYASGFTIEVNTAFPNFILFNVTPQVNSPFATPVVEYLTGGFIAKVQFDDVNNLFTLDSIKVLAMSKLVHNMSGFEDIFADEVNRFYVSCVWQGRAGVIVFEDSGSGISYLTDVQVSDTGCRQARLKGCRFNLHGSSTTDLPIINLSYIANNKPSIIPLNWNQAQGTIYPLISDGTDFYKAELTDGSFGEIKDISVGFLDRYDFKPLVPTTFPMMSFLFEDAQSAGHAYTVPVRQFIGEFDSYDSMTDYEEEYVVKYSGVVYRSLQFPNIGNQPDVSPLFWENISSGTFPNNNQLPKAVVARGDTVAPYTSSNRFPAVIVAEVGDFGNVIMGINCRKTSNETAGLIKIQDYPYLSDSFWDSNTNKPAQYDSPVCNVEGEEFAMSWGTFVPGWNFFTTVITDPDKYFDVNIAVDFETINGPSYPIVPPPTGQEWLANQSYSFSSPYVVPATPPTNQIYLRALSLSGTYLYNIITSGTEPDWSLYTVGQTVTEKPFFTEWQAGDNYNTGDIVSYDITGSQTHWMAFQSAIDNNIGNTPVHTFVLGTTYNSGDQVYWNLNLWTVVVGSTTETPGTGTDWNNDGVAPWMFLGEVALWRVCDKAPPMELDTLSDWKGVQYTSEFSTLSSVQEPCDAGTYFVHSGAPTVNNDGIDTASIGYKFEAGYFWIDNSATDPNDWTLYVCMSNGTASALWRKLSTNILYMGLVVQEDHLLNTGYTWTIDTGAGTATLNDSGNITPLAVSAGALFNFTVADINENRVQVYLNGVRLTKVNNQLANTGTDNQIYTLPMMSAGDVLDVYKI